MKIEDAVANRLALYRSMPQEKSLFELQAAARKSVLLERISAVRDAGSVTVLADVLEYIVERQ